MKHIENIGSIDAPDDLSRMVSVWATVPAYVQQNVKKHAKYNLVTLSDYWRGWIMEGYRRDIEGDHS